MLYSKLSDMHTSKITACVVIHNEDKVLARCLASVVQITKRILVVHDGPCSDNSLKICKQFGCTVFLREYIGEAEPHRAWLLEKVETEYCLQIDADEFLSNDLLDYLRDSLKFLDSAYTAIWPYWTGNRYSTHDWPRKLFLYKLKDITFLGAPHEAVRVQGTTVNLLYILEHRPDYNNLSIRTFWTKWRKWAKIHATYYQKPPMEIKRFPQSTRELDLHYHYWMSFSPFSAIPLGVYHTLACLLSGGLFQGIIGIKSCVFMGLYYLVVSLYVAREKYAKIY